ncbi:hypothetical protein GCM10009555_006430 [Acrocarpospora macrocephala]|uniref:EF-hand domain-containing protein n=1 Tax=Acrocarpospora macrocephala TaxID=150177 RepID=A0A5M3XC65_9ACTN|nr:hypothetical protein [Acrocarpospora macrocephala]GES15638.1 hypothetical protein Amac_092360 [Acrocarpospora macrocephala]
MDVYDAGTSDLADVDGDGYYETAAVDTNSDGVVDAAVSDLDGDGDIDMEAYDTDGDGRVDTAILDTDNDGIADTALFDTDSDGQPDVVAVTIPPTADDAPLFPEATTAADPAVEESGLSSHDIVEGALPGPEYTA